MDGWWKKAHEPSPPELISIIKRKILEFGTHIRSQVSRNEYVNAIAKREGLVNKSRLDLYYDSITMLIIDLMQDVRESEDPNIYYVAIDLQLAKHEKLAYIYSKRPLILIISLKMEAMKGRINSYPEAARLVIGYFSEKATAFVALIEKLMEDGIIGFKNEFNSTDQAKAIKHLLKNPIRTINELGSASFILRSLINDLLTSQVTSNRGLMYKLLELSESINKNINVEMGTQDNPRPYVTLKGGNVFKLQKEAMCRNAANQLNIGILRRHYPHLDMAPLIATLNKFCADYAKNGALELSDWDYTINTYYDCHQEESEFIFAPDVVQYAKDHEMAIANHVFDADAVYKKIYDCIVKTLSDYRTTKMNKLWAKVARHITSIMNKELGVDILFVDSVNDTHVYPRFCQIFADPYEVVIHPGKGRSQGLNSLRNIIDFESAYAQSVNISELSHVAETNLRISTMEIFGKITPPITAANQAAENFIMEGFDLIRFTLNFGYELEYFKSVARIGTMRKVAFAELLDFSYSKPFTLGSLIHGTNEYDYDTCVFYPAVGHPPLPPAFIPSYSLYWFIQDIIRIVFEAPDKTKKTNKRIDRMYEAIVILLCRYRTKGFSMRKFANTVEFVVTGRVLLADLDAIARMFPEDDTDTRRGIRQILAGMLPRNGGELYLDFKNSAKPADYTRDIVNLIALYYPALLIICLILLIFVLSACIYSYANRVELVELDATEWQACV